MRVGLNSDWIRSGNTVLGVSALADGLLRLPEDVLAPMVSLTGGFLADPRIGFVTTWILFYTALYTFAHLAFGFLSVEGETEIPRTAFGFRNLFATTGVILALAIYQIEALETLLLVVTPGMFVAGASFLGYLSVFHEWDLRDPRGRGVEVLERFTPHQKVTAEIERDLAYEGWLGHLGLAVYLLALSTIFGIPVAIAAVILQILVYSFPIPDFLFLGWAVSAQLIPRVSVGPGRDHILDVEFDLERYFLDTIEHATRSMQGFFLVMYCMLGAFLSASYLFVAVGNLPDTAELVFLGIRLLASGVSIFDMVPAWNVLGVVSLLLLAGSYGLWVWIRELQRLPHFLDRWEDREIETTTEPLPRVYGFVGVPIIALLSTGIFVAFDARPVIVGYAVIWPVILAIGFFTVRATFRRDIQRVTGEHRWIYGGFIAQTFTSLLGFSLPTIADTLAADRLPLSQLVTPVGSAVLLVIVALIPSISKYEEQYDDIRRYSLVGLLLVLGSLAAVGSSWIPAEYRFGAHVLAGISLGFSLVLGIARYHQL